jgi:hypothetical protein
MSHVATVNFGIFPAGHRVEVGGYDLCREVAWAGRVADFDKGENEPVAYIAFGIKSSFEALAWLDGFRSGDWYGSLIDLFLLPRALFSVQRAARQPHA